jgi:hypothetical protein
MMEYFVYEVVGDNRKNFIGTIMADDLQEAHELATDEYGSPLRVE